jgi:enediyne biosynthesis protein E4
MVYSDHRIELSVIERRSPHFGLGPETRVKTVEIRWPGGYLQTLNDVQGDRYVTVEEPPMTQGSK